jgi:DNA-binding NarL/FixJ family response regulator
MTTARQVLIVEDDEFLCGLLAKVLTERGFVVHQAHDGARAMDLIDKHDPEALIVDLDLGHGPSGVDVIGALGDRVAEFGVLVLSNYPSANALNPGSSLPASVGFLMKRRLSDPDEVVEALEAVLRDATPSTPAMPVDVQEELAMLTPAQFEMLRLIAMGYSNDQIAQERGVTLRSVESLVNRLFVALELSSDARSNARVKAAMLYARVMGVPRSPS